MESSIIAQVDHYKASIGRLEKGLVNIFLNFDPTENLLILSQIKSCTAVKCITHIGNYENGTGGLAVRLSERSDVFFLQRCLEQIFLNEIES